MSSPVPSDRFDPIGAALFRICRAVAVFGGVVLCAAGLLTVVSVLCRYLLSSPLDGDFELVQACCAIAVFAFLPYCQMVKGNVIVDFFTAKFRPAIRCSLDAAGALFFTVIAGLVAWRLTVGGIGFYETQETTVILEIPHYYYFYVMVPFAGLLALVCLYSTWRNLQQAMGRVADDGPGMGLSE
jgi:TRAP-type C4-dicarboxylate transport system permease small subunit